MSTLPFLNRAVVLTVLLCAFPGCLLLAELDAPAVVADSTDGEEIGATDTVDQDGLTDGVDDGAPSDAVDVDDDAEQDALQDAVDADADGDDGPVDVGDAADTADSGNLDGSDGGEVLTPNPCGGLRVLSFAGEEARPGVSCGALDEGFLVCNGPDALRCVGAAAANACGGTGLLPVELGETCGCGGVTVCSEDGGVVCAGSTQTNTCGGCSALTGRPGYACDAEGSAGRFVCVTPDELSCVAGDVNACGGAAGLLVDGVEVAAAAPGGACVTLACGPGRYVCDGTDELVCVADRPCNACGGSGPLAGAPGDVCGACSDGTWACDGATRVTCAGAATPNACGACQPLDEEPGQTCTTDSDGAGLVLCRDGGTVCSPLAGPATDGGSGGQPLNACGGTGDLTVPAGLPGAGEPATLGGACGACDGGELVCDGAERVRCTVSDAAQVNVCGGCDAVTGALNAACGTCGSGRTSCDGTNALRCDGDLGAIEGTNACGGCGPLPGAAGNACGTCLVWGCSGTRLECTPTSIGVGCGSLSTCADLACGTQNRTCEESDGTTDARCAGCITGFTQQPGGTCAPVDCGTLSTPANGSLVTPAGTTFGGTATYSCSSGYLLVGDTTRTCQASGVWSGSAPQCEPVDCGTLPNPGNGTVAIPDGTTLGGTATYSCSAGFTLVGARTRTCQTSGAWSGSAPSCVEVDCGTLAAPANGGVNTPSGTARGATATYVCDNGYALSGAATRTCQDTGDWSGRAPSCNPVDCGVLANPTNGAVQTPSTTFGGTASYSCSSGYLLVGDVTRTCQATGVWSGSVPQCEAVDCGTLANPGNGTVAIPDGTTLNATATYSCSSGFTLVGGRTRTCQASGAWSGSAPTCSEVDCGTLSAPSNGTVNTPSGTGRGATATYSCSSGYTLSGTSTRTCGDTGTWAGTAPTCTAVDCGPLANPTNGVVQAGSGTTFGGVATYSCAEGYVVQGADTRTCQATGLWSGSPATCPPVDCGTPPVVTNGSRTFTTTTYQATATYACSSGFDRVGAASITCLATGAWTAPPVCNDINECTVGGVCTGFANTCTNTSGSWSCGCSAGYTGTTVTGSNATCVGVLGSACSANTNCPGGSWCPTNTLPELRRCSPRVFSGQAHQMDFMFVPAGTFEQGTPGATDGERPTTATISRNYFVSRTEVTQGQWRAASGATNPSCYQSTTGTSCTTSNANNSGPVENLDWYSALRYANWLSIQNGLSECYTLSGCTESIFTGWYDGDHNAGCASATFVGQSCTGYRLLTETEWERAARAGTTTSYYWGESNESATLYAWYSVNSGARAQVVGQKLANLYGLVDISGNIQEWVFDSVGVGTGSCFVISAWSRYPSPVSSDYFRTSSSGGFGTFNCQGHRGGGADSIVSSIGVASRDGNERDSRDNRVGFRLARTVTTFPDTTCPTLARPTNGTVTATSLLVGAAATYSCSPSFYVNGTATRTCQPDGTWTGEAPTCVLSPTLGSTCAADAECQVDEWCPTNTLPELRRCSPRLFGGQAHEMDFMFVPAGTFQQGTPGATDDERPYTATLTRNYLVSRTEVTQGQWRAASGAVNPSCFQSTTGTSCSTSNANDNGPVENLDWWSTLRYANWLSAQNGLESCYTLVGCTEGSNTDWYDGDHDTGCTSATFVGQSCTGYRLLTESEWERAVRGGTTTTYYWGDSSDTATIGQYAWYSLNSGSRTQPIGQKLANAYGLVDMIGHVQEWVWDWFATAYPTGSSTNYVGPATGSDRAHRGGNFLGGATTVSPANRSRNVPSLRGNNLGFRLARTVP
jgi:formylglycine-generating enzyme required for sulfatase activity